MSKNRKSTLSIFGHLYKRIPNYDLGSCLYCSAPKTCYDHVPPLNSVAEYGSKTLRASGVRFLLVPVCSDCNSLLGAKPLWFIDERFDYLFKKAEKALDKFGNGWSDDEVQELGYNLKGLVKDSQVKRKEAVRKHHAIERNRLMFDLDKETIYNHSDLEE